MDMSYSEIKEFLASPKMRVADHFMATCTDEQGRITSATVKTGAVCEICFECFKDETELWLHVRWQHRADVRLACSAKGCGKRFMAREHKTQHMTHHGGFRQADPADGSGRRSVAAVARPPTCELCGRLFANNKILRKHVSRAHPQAIPYACGVCCLLSRDVAMLVRHVRRYHADCHARKSYGNVMQRAIRCDVCCLELGNYALVKKHRLIHVAL